MIPKEIEFYFGGDNKNFFPTCTSLDLNSDNENFVGFLSKDFSYKIMTENKIAKHIETGNIYARQTQASFFMIFLKLKMMKRKN